MPLIPQVVPTQTNHTEVIRMATKKAPPIGGTTGGTSQGTGSTQPVFGQAGDNMKNHPSQGVATPNTSPTFSSHPGHGSAKRTIAGEKNG